MSATSMYLLTLPARYGVVRIKEPGAAAIAAKACIDIWGVEGIVTKVRIETPKPSRRAKKRRTRR